MPIDEVAEGLFRIIGRFVAYFIIDVLFEIVFYLIGKVVLRVFTLGKYPPPPVQSHSTGFVQFIGILAFVAAFAVLVMVMK